MRPLVLLLVAKVSLFCGSALAQSVEDFYKKNSIKIIVGQSPGGVYDLTARRIASSLKKYIPGSPDIFVQNMPGAGSLNAANWMVTQAPKDGTVLGAFAPNLITRVILKEPEIKFAMSDISFLASINSGDVYCYSFKQNNKHELVLGGTFKGSIAGDYPILLRNIFGDRIKVVLGYQNVAELINAMEKGEVDGFCGTAISSVKEYFPHVLENPRLRLPFVFKAFSDEAVDTDTLNVIDYLDEGDKAAAKFIFSQHEFMRPYFVSSSVPKERVEALRNAIEQLFESKEFLESLSSDWRSLNVKFSDQLEPMIRDLQRTPPHILERVKRLVRFD